MIDEAIPSPESEAEPKHFGTGWISGVLSVCLGAVGLLAVLCFHFPSLLTMPELASSLPGAVRAGVTDADIADVVRTGHDQYLP
jgi:hypothetical protein